MICHSILAVIGVTCLGGSLLLGILSLIMCIRHGRKMDPVHSCPYYKKDGECPHVDGFLCDYPGCKILEDLKRENGGSCE